MSASCESSADKHTDARPGKKRGTRENMGAAPAQILVISPKARNKPHEGEGVQQQRLLPLPAFLLIRARPDITQRARWTRVEEVE